jgi:hypothetical protein
MGDAHGVSLPRNAKSKTASPPLVSSDTARISSEVAKKGLKLPFRRLSYFPLTVALLWQLALKPPNCGHGQYKLARGIVSGNKINLMHGD